MAKLGAGRIAWRKSSYSGNGGGNCVEVAAAGGLSLARDSKDPEGPVLAVDSHRWGSFLGRIKAGDFDRG
ncbi:DUF397 domain-containing protein [Actinomadura atramentaria]|uniref:DUF397 domain-containing protein n=1 Tax=Actinomadura atramentaria TaxID=1990 RepID=UPI000370F6AC|nr:DUF397 domain-containing protein [Actinomadura atramentaria]